MARFSNKIESLRYADRQHKSIEILYKNGVEIHPYYIEVDYNNQDFLDLLEEYSIEDIEDQTTAYYEKLNVNRYNAIHNEAKKMFDEWVINAQKDLDEQDEERYKIFEKYKDKQLETFQSEADAQVERRVQEGYKGIQAEINKQYEEVEAYREEQLKILQTEVDEQVERRIAEGFADVDTYREKQLSILQDELDEQVKQRYEEADKYKESQIGIIQQEVKTDLLSKFNKPSVPIRYTPEKVAEYIIDNFKNEDMVFKTKLAIFNLPEVKNNQDREIKMKVRKAKSIPELFAVYNDIQHNHS